VRAIGATGLDLIGLADTRALSDLAQFDSIVSWYGANRPEFREQVAGLPFQFLDALPSGGIHAVDFYLRQVGAPEGAVPRIECTAARQPFIAVHPFSGSIKKNWPLDRFLELERRATKEFRFCIGPEQKFEGALRIDDLYLLACWLASAEAYVGNDSGVTHLAAAVGTKTVALFGPTDPAVWAPRGNNVRVIHKSSMEEIGVEEVLEALC
jgi:heptosyltransferase-3